MPHPDLTELVRRLEVAVNNGTQRNALLPTANQIANKIRLKHDRLFAREKINLFQWATAVQNAPNQIGVYSANRDFSVIQRRDIDIVFHYKSKGNTLYSSVHQLDVETSRSDRRLILENPFIALNPKNLREGIQSWSNVKSISFIYKRHLPNSNWEKKSKFLAGINIIALEKLLFKKAYGLMTNDGQIYFYGLFNSDVGTLINKKRTPYVVLQCDRKTRPSKKSKGTFVEIHSYPISRSELTQDFSGAGANYVSLIDNLVFQIP